MIYSICLGRGSTSSFIQQAYNTNNITKNIISRNFNEGGIFHRVNFKWSYCIYINICNTTSILFLVVNVIQPRNNISIVVHVCNYMLRSFDFIHGTLIWIKINIFLLLTNCLTIWYLEIIYFFEIEYCFIPGRGSILEFQRRAILNNYNILTTETFHLAENPALIDVSQQLNRIKNKGMAVLNCMFIYCKLRYKSMHFTRTKYKENINSKRNWY